jgi:anti-sigma factor RsiW
MSATTSEDVVLRRYLLGNVAPDVRERIEGRLFSDDKAFWEHLCLVEDELIESYVAGELETDEARLFERSFLCTDERRSKLEFVRALKAYVATQQAVRPTLWQRLQFMVSVPAWAVAAAAVALVVLPIAGGFFGRTADRADMGATDVSAFVSAGIVRSAGGELPRVQLSPGCKLLRLRVEPDVEHPRYAATLFEVSGAELWSQNGLAAAEVDGRTAVTLTLPCEILPVGDYYVTLSDNGGRASFRVLRP